MCFPGKLPPVSNPKKIQFHRKCRDEQRNNEYAWPSYAALC